MTAPLNPIGYCNQCEKPINDPDTECGVVYSVGQGPIYVCLDCKPAMTLEDTLIDIQKFMEMVELMHEKEDENRDNESWR